MNQLRLFSLLTSAALLFQPTIYAATPEEIQAANGVIQRFTDSRQSFWEFRSLEPRDGCPAYATEVSNGKLTISGSDGIALCKGFYDYIQSQGAGIFSWTGKRFDLPLPLKNQPRHEVVSPVPYHYYFNVVTYGYTMPYWDWNRWEKEIDWMALHGINMPLALVAQEAITSRVFKRLGLTQQEIDNYFSGPAHLPWMRMGNLSRHDGPLPQEWHQEQIQLQHRILRRMRSLGMTPICPGFSGFVPPEIKRLYPSVKLVETTWGGRFHNWMVLPDQQLFLTIGKMFIEEWEKEFGRCSHYLVDSFNEMNIPFPSHDKPERYSMLAAYGDKVYRSITASSPNAVWVIQGWMFGYQPNIWDPASTRALFSKVPDDKLLILDLAVDYNRHWWHSTPNWGRYDGFFRKNWVYSVIPNMGGKTGMTGVLDFYANGHLEALQSPKRGHLVGIGMAPEGIENNEVIYELLSDAAWSSSPINLDEWLQNYDHCRYGKHLPALDHYWKTIRRSVYGSFTDHPRYNWQFRPGQTTRGTINTNPEFYQAIEAFAACADHLKDSPLYLSDLVELTAAYLGGKIELLIQNSETAMQHGDLTQARQLELEIETLMLGMDRLLESHPIHRLSVWLGYARLHGSTPQQKDYYESNARRLVTVWGPPVDDYAAKIWSGLIRDYYLPRRQQYLKAKFSPNVPVNLAQWEQNWVEQSHGISPMIPYPDPIQAARQLIAHAKKITSHSYKAPQRLTIGTWDPSQVSTNWQVLSWNVPVADLKRAQAIRFDFIRGHHRLDISQVSIEMDGIIVADIQQNGSTGDNDINNTYALKLPQHLQGNNSCIIKASVRTAGGNDSFGNVELIFPAD